MTGVSIVVPTLGRPSLDTLLTALAGLPSTVELLLVDDRRDRTMPLPCAVSVGTVLSGRAAGPAAARNVGWRAARHDWIAFLDDDVVPSPQWYPHLLADLDTAPDVGGVQGGIRVPLPGRRPTDWERVTAALADGAWLTADMAYRRAALESVGGFDERFPRAFREDADLAYRVRCAGWRLERGHRTVTHPVRPESMWVSVRTQRGNADDALLRQLYGHRWRSMLDLPPGRRPRHALIAAAGALAVGTSIAWLAAVRRSRRRHTRPGSTAGRRLGWTAVLAGAAWALGTAEFAAARILPGPGTPAEIARMALTSVAIPPLAVAHWVRGRVHWRAARAWGGGR